MKIIMSMRSLLHATLGSFLFLSANACSQVDRLEWTEEVQLANGVLVVVTRSATRDSKGSPVSRRGAIRSFEVVFPEQRAMWRGDAEIRPLALEVADGIPFIAVHLQSREMCAKYDNPAGGVVFFRWDGREWARVARDQYPKAARVNLLQSPWGRTSAEDVSGFIEHKNKHTRPMNFQVNTPIEQRVADKASDACELYKTR